MRRNRHHGNISLPASFPIQATIQFHWWTMLQLGAFTVRCNSTLPCRLFVFPSGLFVSFLILINRIQNIHTLPTFFLCATLSSDRLNQNSFVYSQAEAVGWGRTSYGGPVSTNLQKVELTVIPNSECNKNYPYQISTAQMCTFSPMKDICDVSAFISPFFPRFTSHFLIRPHFCLFPFTLDKK